MPIGAIVFDDERVLGRAYTQERALRRRIVHADLLALLQADEALGFTRAAGELTLAVSLEPCLMCMGAAITLGVTRVWFARESPDDGGAELVQSWAPPTELPFFAKPREVVGGILRDEARALFAEYARGTGLSRDAGLGARPQLMWSGAHFRGNLQRASAPKVMSKPARPGTSVSGERTLSYLVATPIVSLSSST